MATPDSSWLGGENWLLWVLGLIGFALSNWWTHFLTKRGKRDDIVIKRRMELAEQLAASITEDYAIREGLVEWFEENRDLIGEEQVFQILEREPDRFERHFEQFEQMNRCMKTGARIAELSRLGMIYFEKSLIGHVDKYLRSAPFSRVTDKTGDSQFLMNLVEFARFREENLDKVLEALRKAVR